MWDSSRRLLLMDGDKLVTSGRTSLEAGTQGAPEDLTLSCSGDSSSWGLSLVYWEASFCAGWGGMWRSTTKRGRGEGEGRAVPLDPAEVHYQRQTVQEERPVSWHLLGRGLGGGRWRCSPLLLFCIKNEESPRWWLWMEGCQKPRLRLRSVEAHCRQTSSHWGRPPYPWQLGPNAPGLRGRWWGAGRLGAARVLVAKEAALGTTWKASPCLGAQIRRGSWSSWSSTTSRDTAAH